MKEVININNFKQYTELKENARDNHEIVLFKYSPFCGISRSVERIFDRWFDKLPEETDLVCLKLDVVTARGLSREIAEELDVRHESPQVIWLDKTLSVKWHDSHYNIEASELKKNLNN